MIKRHGYIQHMSPDKGPVLVFVEELGEKWAISPNKKNEYSINILQVFFKIRLHVPFESLEVIPASANHEDEDFSSELASIGE